jgi:ADP-ribosylglycohydrolase
MRILPIALCDTINTAELIEHAEAASSVTHAHPRSRLVCALYCLAAKRLLAGELDRQAALNFAGSELRAHRGQKHGDELSLIFGFSERSGSGYVVDTFWSAWTAFVSARSYEECLRLAVAFGNDTDTTACVAGGLGGIYWGVSGIPGDWLADMAGRGVALPIIARLLDKYGSAQLPSVATEQQPSPWGGQVS